MVDHGSRAPVLAFVEAFASMNIPIMEAEACAPMGLAKIEHIRHHHYRGRSGWLVHRDAVGQTRRVGHGAGA